MRAVTALLIYSCGGGGAGYLRKLVLDRSVLSVGMVTTFTLKLGRGIYYILGGGRLCGRRLLS